MATVDQPTPKSRLLSVLQGQPEDSSYEELLRELACASMIDRGLKDAEAGRVVTNEEARQRIESWRK